MTTRNVRLSDDDIDRLLLWGELAYAQLRYGWGETDNQLRDRLIEAKLSPSVEWPAGWPEGGADKQWNTKPITGVAVPRLLTFDDLPEPSTEESDTRKPGPQAQTLGWNRGWPGVIRFDEGGWGGTDYQQERSTEEPGER